MSIVLSSVLLIAALFSVGWIMHRIRKSKVRLEDSLFWVGLGIILGVLGLFPQVSYAMARFLGFQSASNFVLFLMICLLFEKVFTLSITHSQMEDRYVVMIAELALRCKDLEKKIRALEEKGFPDNRTDETEIEPDVDPTWEQRDDGI